VLKKHTHLFRIEAPIYNPDWKIVVFGSTASLGNWDYEKVIHLSQTDFGIWETSLEIPENELFNINIVFTIQLKIK
jgi:4-alpha-glucanotransferase